ncbi:MAG: protein kinase, partial [Rhodospirillales bacterium]|nr:protein kinase [Acetobacter sp.]
MALDNTEADLQADPLPTRSVDLCVAPKCLKCGRAALVLPSITSRICERCMLAWAFEPCEVPVAEPEPEPSWNSDAPGLGPYVVLEEIGRGGMGVIYRAVHRETHEVVALKTILPQYADDAETVARFRREAETAQGLEHPHTMPILAVGSSDEGVPFFAMPLALGGGLHQLKARYHRRWRRIAELMVKVSRAVHHAHTRGVLHRDIKP